MSAASGAPVVVTLELPCDEFLATLRAWQEAAQTGGKLVGAGTFVVELEYVLNQLEVTLEELSEMLARCRNQFQQVTVYRHTRLFEYRLK